MRLSSVSAGTVQNVGSVRIADETVLRIDGANVWLDDIIDQDTRFMLASRVTTARTTADAKQLMQSAAKVAGKHPAVVFTDRNNSYLDGIEQAYGADTEHRQGSPFTLVNEDSTNLIERFHGTLKARTKTMRGLKSIETAIQFADGFMAFYNYLRPHEYLQGKTLGEAAGVEYPYKTWTDIVCNTEPKVEVLITRARKLVISEQEPVVRPIIRRHYKADRKRLTKRKPAIQAVLHITRKKRA